MKAVFLVAVVLLVGTWCVEARAQVYQCTDAHGRVSFQDRACAAGGKQRIVDVPSHAPAGYVPPPVTVAAPQAAAGAVAPRNDVLPAPTPPPLPTLYACVGAVNGEPYLASAPPAPYLAPLGVMGYPPQSLSQAYGTRGGAGVSAPELSKPRVGGPRIATGLAEVHDTCMPATHAQVCGHVQREFDDNHRKLRRAMPSERPPLERREQQLSAQLKNC